MRRVILAALVAACSVLEPRLLGAQPLPDEISALPVTLDGGVSAHVRVGDVLYVGGEFTGLAPRSRRIGPFGVFAAATADLRAADPSLIGQAVAIVDDGDGGWFVVVGNRIVRLDATGRERPWPAQISGATLADVYALARVGPHLLIGGTFGEFGGQPRGRLAVVDIATAALLPFDAAVVGEAVHVLHVSGDRLYLGGSFTSVAGLPRNHVAQFDLTTGTLLPWAPQVEGTIGVRAIVEAGPRVYVGGTFTTVNGATRLNLATVSVSTGALEPFAPLIFSSRGPSAVRTLAIAGTTLFVGGRFDSVHPASRNGAAAFDLNTEMLLPWAPLATGFVNQISAVTDGILLAGAGLVHSSDPTPRGVLKVSAVTGVPLAWQPAVGGSVAAVWSDGAQVALGGSFSTYHAVPAAYVVGLNLIDGSHTRLPAPNGPVRALATDGLRLFIGGSFSSVDGQPRSLLAAIDLDTRHLLPYAPVIESLTVSAQVTALHLSGGRLYVGGGFDLVNGMPRVSVAAIDPDTGTLLAWAPPTIAGDAFRGIASILAVSGRVWIGGRFSAVGGTPRNGLAVLSESSATLDALDFAPDQPTTRLALDEGFLYASGYWLQFGGLARPNRARLDPQSGALDPAWQLVAAGGYAPTSVLNGEVYTTGSFASPSASLASFRQAFPPPPVVLSRTAWTPVASWAGDVVAFPDGVFATGSPHSSGPTPSFFPRRAPGGAPHGAVDFGVHLQRDLVTLRWVPSLSGAAPSNYRLVAGSRPGAADIADVVVGRTPELSLQVRPGQYFVRVAPIANGVTGPASAELGFNAGAAGCVTIPEPPALSFTGLPALIQWTPPTAGAQPSGFELRARVVPGALNAVRIPLPAMTTSYSTAGAPPGTYYVAVAAVNACGISGPSNEVQVVVSLPGAPAAPAALAALVGGSSVALSWTAPAGSVTGYVLEAGSAPGLADLVAGFALGPTPSFVVPGVPPGRYYVRVRAAIGALVSAPSNEIAADVP